MLSKKLIDRIRPFVEAKAAGDLKDPETIAYKARIKQEAEDLKLESFGVEVRYFHLDVGRDVYDRLV